MIRHLLIAAILATALPAAAQTSRCAAPEAIMFNDAALPQTGRHLRSGEELQVAILGSSSSLPTAARGMPTPYTASLAPALQRRLPGITVAITNHSARALNAVQMETMIRERILHDRPHLLIWQTGTVDAAQQIDVNSFSSALESGLAALKAAGIDVVLVSPQYRARLAALVDPAPYSEYLDRIGEADGVPVFPRYDIMRHWAEGETFDIRSNNQATQMREAEAENVCIAELLAGMIVTAARRAAP